MSASYRLGDYLLAMEGLAILRAWGTSADIVSARSAEAVAIGRALDEEPYCSTNVVPEFDASTGYRAWAATYDSMPNVLIDLEERVVCPLLDTLPPGRALDAACGTGRHARWLAEHGHDVVGIDASPEMLSVARVKVPAARFERGGLDSLPAPDAAFDLAICALALTHLPALDGAIAELARVLMPGGRLILTDVHPVCTALGLHAFFKTEDGGRGCIQNRYHPLSAYLSAFQTAGLRIVRCIEAPWDEQAIATMGVSTFAPQALRDALCGLPFVLVWELTKSA
jgi:ubiquinone/menaquinone biosynthesis C-methylase UbiE